METGTIELREPFDLQATVESGQSYLWDREDGRMYERSGAYGGSHWYSTVVRRDGADPAVVRVRQVDGRLEWESTVDAEPILRRRLRLDDDLDAVRASAPDDDLLSAAFDDYWGMRLVDDPPFETLVTFICSAQMRVGRIHGMQRALEAGYGEAVHFDGDTYYAYPTPEALADATEAELRDLGLGYRAPYVQRTAEMVADGEAAPGEAAEMAYEDAREYLTQFVGVGQKVADCICLFALDFTEAIPLDTWIRTAIEDYYPDCERDSYDETARALRERLGGEYAGYAQTYLFHHLRTRDGG